MSITLFYIKSTLKYDIPGSHGQETHQRRRRKRSAGKRYWRRSRKMRVKAETYTQPIHHNRHRSSIVRSH